MLDDTAAVVEAALETPQEATAAPVVEQTPVIDENTQQTPEEKKFSQEEVDKIVEKRLAREQRKAQRMAQQVDTPVVPVAVSNLSIDQFETPEAYADALATQKAQQLIAQKQTRETQAAIEDKYGARVEEAEEKYDDFHQVVNNPKLHVSDAMAETIKSSDIGPDIAYWLGNNPKESARIASLTILQQAKEIGLIESRLTANPMTKKTTTAPTPIKPVTTSRASSSGVVDTTDPRSVASMSTSEWIEQERRRQIAKLKANQR